MDRPLLAVILGTFTLRLSTGLTGGALVYYLNDLEQYGGPHADAITIATFSALFYASELIGSPLFGVLSDRLGHRRVLLFGPLFGGIAVVIFLKHIKSKAATEGSAPVPVDASKYEGEIEEELRKLTPED